MNSKQNVIEDIYSLSPMQQGILFHALMDERAAVYLMQMSATITGPLDVSVFKSAWQRVVDRHATLRTAFVWEGLREPVQVVQREVELKWIEEDWRSLAASRQEEEFQDYLRRDREKGIELTRPPLMRLTLLRTAEQTYRFVWTRHHLLLDGWSEALLIQEIFTLYQAARRGRSLPDEPSRSYGEYIEWLQRQEPSSAQNFWRRTLEGFSAPTPFGVDHTAEEARTHASEQGQQELALSSALTAALEALAREHQLTLNTLVQGAWALLLGRYSGQPDVVFGATVSGRPAALPGVETVIGNFINTLPVRAHVNPRQPLVSWLRGLQEAQAEMRQYEYSSLVQIQGWSDVPRGLPLFESITVFENYPTGSAFGTEAWNEDTQLRVTDLRSDGLLDVPLALTATPGRELTLALKYDARRFSEPVIEQMLSHLRTALESFAADPAQPLSSINFIDETERRRLLVEWNDTRQDYAEAGATLPQLFVAQARRRPQSIALCYEGERLTYGELDARTNQLAHRLQRLGVGPETLVGIYMERSLEMVLAVLGTLKAGGAYVPFDTSSPRERLAAALDEAKPVVVLTQAALAAQLPADGAHVLRLDTDWNSLAGESVEAPVCRATGDNLAYMIYTSGSTGKPKGVMNTHRGILNRLLWMKNSFRTDETDRMLQKTPYSFDVSVCEFFYPLLTGARLVVARPGGHQDSDYLADVIAEEGITILHVVPSLLRLLLDEKKFEKCRSLRYVLCGGESLPGELARRFFQRSDAALYNLYGPTEAAVDVTFWPCAADEKRKTVPIGRPIGNTQIYLLDGELRPVAMGVAGELYVGGAGLSRGYFGQPDLTAERFIPNPFAETRGARLYKTGDIARYRSDGSIEFLGRTDAQVKLRGYRIELGEIEKTLSRHEQVREAVVLLREDTPGNRRLVAYVVPASESAFEVVKLRSFLQQNLPPYMVPSAFVALNAFPQTTSGKIDRRQLPPPEEDRATLTTSFVAPRTPVEESLAAMWREILAVQTVGIHDNFFELGGHSLMLMQLASRINEAFGVQFPLRVLFNLPTILEQAAAIDAQQSGQSVKESEGGKIPSISREGEIPLSFAQQRLWFLDRLEPGSPLYNCPAAVRLTGRLQVEALTRALREIVRRHEVLRTSFKLVEGRPVQVISALPLNTLLRDLSASAEPEREARRLIDEEARRPFQLDGEPLLRATLIRLGEQEHILLVVMHHIVADAWSTGILVRELAALYEAFSRGEPSPLDGLPVQYADFAQWQRQYLQGETLENLVAYWKQRLSGSLPALELPPARPRSGRRTFSGARQSLTLSSELTDVLRAFSRREGVTLFMTLLAAFEMLLYRHTGQTDILVGTPVAGRNRREIEGLIGFFVNTVVLRTDLSGKPSFRELLRRVAQVTLEAYDHQDLPFEKLVEVLQPERETGHGALFQVMFVLQNAHISPLRLAGLTLTPLEIETGTSKFDLTLEVVETERELTATFEYNTDLFDAPAIKRMLEQLQTLLEAVVSDPQRSVSRLPLLNEETRSRLLRASSEGEVATAAPLCIHEMFEAQAARTPAAVAVIGDGRQLTYRELNERANQLAHHLQSLGVGPESCVGLLLERSLELVVAILGVLKSGAAYLPLDPAYPASRISFMLKDARSPLLLTERSLLPLLSDVQEVQTLCLDRDGARFAKQSTENCRSAVAPENLAYVIYTSGSTGLPKGVLISHANVARLFAATRRWFDFGPKDVWTLFHSSAFDFSVWEMWGALCFGGRLVVVPYEVSRSPQAFLALLGEQKVTVLNQTPTAFRQLLAAMREGREPLALRFVIFGGEALELRSLGEWYDGPNEAAQLVNMYGITETTVHVTYHPIDERECREAEGSPIGSPIGDLQVYVLDEELEPVPLGVRGEMYVGGAGLGRGYLGRPELTATRFIPDPFGREAGGRLYRTGDAARWTAEGRLEYLGRVDQQVKVRGFRIELGEIETVLSQHHSVSQCVVVARDGATGDKRLVAYVVGRDGAALSSQELRAHLKERLPEYMLPSAFVALERLPLTTNGKVDKQALPSAEDAGMESNAVYTPPRTPVEQMLADIWMEVMQIKEVSVHDDFFELGGHSLLMIQVVSRISDVFHVDLPLKDFFRYPTLAGQAVAVTQAQAAQGDAERMNELLERLDELSPEEVERLLQERAIAQS